MGCMLHLLPAACSLSVLILDWSPDKALLVVHRTGGRAWAQVIALWACPCMSHLACSAPCVLCLGDIVTVLYKAFDLLAPGVPAFNLPDRWGHRLGHQCTGPPGQARSGCWSCPPAHWEGWQAGLYQARGPLPLPTGLPHPSQGWAADRD